MVSDMEDKYIKLSDAKNALADYIAEQTVSKYGSLEACREARFGAEGAMKELDYVPTADVVPKSEVEKLKSDLLVWKQNRFNIFQRTECYEMTRQKIAREIFEEIYEDCFDQFGYINYEALAELKKKYTEENQNVNGN